MNEYQRIAMETRKKVSKLTLQQQREVSKIYDNSISSMAEKIARSKDKTLTNRWLTDYQKELKKAKVELRAEINKSTRGYITKAAKMGTETQQLIMAEAFRRAEVEVIGSFTGMLSSVQKNVVNDIIKGNLYKDNKTLSARIWNYGSEFEKDLQYIVAQGMVEKKSAVNLAKDLEQFVKPAAKRPATWGKAYPNLRNKPVDYNAMRLARTSINHAYQTATIQSSASNPYVNGIEWRSAMIHGRTCELCMERDGQIFPVDSVPLDHANGLCTMLPSIPKSLDEIAQEIKSWVDGEENEVLDKWYNGQTDIKIKDKGINKIVDTNLLVEKNINTVTNTQEVEELLKSKNWFINEGGYNANDMISLEGIDLESAKQVYLKYEKTFEKYPVLKGRLASIKAKDKINALADCSMYDGQIRLNITNFRDHKRFDRLYESQIEYGHFPVNTNWASTITHEIGHAIDGYLTYQTEIMGFNKDHTPKVASQILRRETMKELGLKIGETRKHLSGYATKNHKEWMAEAFSEYIDSPNPRPVAKLLGEKLDRLMNEVSK